MTPAPISVERLRELLDKALDGVTVAPSGCVSFPTETAHLSVSFLAKHGAALLHQLAERDAEIERLRRECDLRKHAVDRWVPCPDHRDKTDGRCYVCAKEAAERAREEAHAALAAIRDSTFRNAMQLRSIADRFLAASGGVVTRELDTSNVVTREVTVRHNDDGSLDEVVGSGQFHLEQMDYNKWWMQLGPHMVTLTARGKISAWFGKNEAATPASGGPRDG